MIIDSSAFVAVVRGEPDAADYLGAMSGHEKVSTSAASYLETAIVLDSRQDPRMGRLFDQFLSLIGASVLPVTASQAKIARQAYRDFGRGSGHAARLNYGDCFAYALAAERDEPLLYKGEDFARTDIRSALESRDPTGAEG